MAWSRLASPTGRSDHRRLFACRWASLSKMLGTSYVVFASYFRPTPVRHPNTRWLNWIRLTNQYMASVAFSTGLSSHICCFLTPTCHPALLYYDYLLTFDRERRLFWSRNGFQQWGSLLFFLNRYCGILGHIPVLIQTFVPSETSLYRHCDLLHSYHQILAVIMQTIAGCMSFRLACMTSTGRLNSTLGSYFHRADLCPVQQKPGGAYWVDFLGSCYDRDWRRESRLLKIHLHPR